MQTKSDDEILRDLQDKVRDMLDQYVSTSDQLVERLRGCGVIEEHARNDLGYRVANKIVAAIGRELAARYEPNERGGKKDVTNYGYFL